MRHNGIDIWPTPMMTKEVKSFLGSGNFDTEFTQNDEDLMKPQNKQNKNEQDNRDMIMLPEGLFLNLLDHEFDDERALKMAMNSLIRSKPYWFMDSKDYIIIFQKLPQQLLSMMS
jgi:hypothetical protein